MISEKLIPFPINSPAIRMVSGDVQEYWKIPVSWAIPIYNASAISFVTFSGSKRP